MRVLILISIVGTSLAPAALGQATQPSMETLFSELQQKTGSEYVRARDRLLTADPRQAREILASKRKASKDPVEQLCLEALIHRAEHPGKFEDAWRRALEAGTTEVMDRAGQLRPGPWPGQAAYSLVSNLGPVSGDYAAELLTNDVLEDAPAWHKLSLVLVLRMYRQTPEHLHNFHSKKMQNLPPEDPRMGWALLRFFADSKRRDSDADLVNNTVSAIGDFASPELLASARAAKDRAQSELKKQKLEAAIGRVDYELRMREMAAQRAATQPAIPPAH